jgi:hypothetical protein
VAVALGSRRRVWFCGKASSAPLWKKIMSYQDIVASRSERYEPRHSRLCTRLNAQSQSSSRGSMRIFGIRLFLAKQLTSLRLHRTSHASSCLPIHRSYQVVSWGFRSPRCKSTPVCTTAVQKQAVLYEALLTDCTILRLFVTQGWTTPIKAVPRYRLAQAASIRRKNRPCASFFYHRQPLLQHRDIQVYF